MNKDTIDFIIKHENTDTTSLILKAKNFPGVDVLTAIKAIDARKKIKNKIPSWYEKINLTYPYSISVEQSSSEKTAAYKSIFVEPMFRIADLTGGMGVDSYFFSLKAKEVHYYESSPQLCEAASHNFKELERQNIKVTNLNIQKDIIQDLGKYDLVYLDPARRGKDGAKLFSIDQCEPNILELKDEIFKLTDTILVKFSPMLDIHSALISLPEVREVHIVSVTNECKELLFLLHQVNVDKDVEIKTINILNNRNQNFNFQYSDESKIYQEYYAEIKGSYLYEPNSSILKAGAFKVIGNQFSINKLATNTHLYTSDTLYPDFPGKIFSIVEIIDFNKVNLKTIGKKYNRASVSAKNISLTSEELKKRLGTKEDSNFHIFGVSLQSKVKKIIVVKRFTQT